VREVVAHITMPFRYGRGKFVLELAKSRGRFSELAARAARRDAAAMTPADLAGPVRSGPTSGIPGSRRAAGTPGRWPTT